MKWSSLAPLALVVSAVAPQLAAAGMYREPAVELDAKSFKRVMATEQASMVAFVAPWCGHCKSLAPEYTAAASSLSPLIPFYYIDCDQAKNKPLCGEHDIKGFPTIKAFPKGANGASRDYQGERRKGALIEYAKSLVPERVKKYRADDGGDKVVDKFVAEKPALPHALLVHPSAPSIPFLWKVLGHRLSGKMQLGYVRDTPAHDILSTLGIYDPVTHKGDAARLVFFPAGSSENMVVYDGALKFNPILEWLETGLNGRVPDGSAASASSAASGDQARSNVAEAKPADAEEAKAAVTDKEAAEAKRRAKLDEAERRDRVRREKLAAKRAAEEASPVDAPAPEPVDEEEADKPLDIPVEPKEGEAVDGKVGEGSPVDAPAPETEDGEVEGEHVVRDEL